MTTRHERVQVLLCRDCVTGVVGGDADDYGYILAPPGGGCWRCGAMDKTLAPFSLMLATDDGMTYKYFNHQLMDDVLLHAELGGTQLQLDDLLEDDDE